MSAGGVGAGLGGLDRGPDRLPRGQVELGRGGRGDVGGGDDGPSSWTRRLSPWRWMPVTVAGQVLRGLPSGWFGCSATADGRERDERVAVHSVGDGEGEPVGDRDGVAVGPAAVEVEPDQPGDVVGARAGR